MKTLLMTAVLAMAAFAQPAVIVSPATGPPTDKVSVSGTGFDSNEAVDVYGGDKSLSADPETIREDLNEWVALDRPGHYSLYVTSGRVSRRNGAKLENLTLRSNTLEFDVVEASPAWQAQSVSAAAATLRGTDSTPEEKRAAARTLRFLDSPESVRELARQLATSDDGSRWDLVAGILGSQHRAEAGAALEAQLAAPGAAITADFPSALAETKVLSGRETMPPYPDQDEQQQNAWRARLEARVKQFGQLQDDLYAQAAALVGSKRGTAQAETVRTLLVRPAPDPSDWKPPYGLSGMEIASAFGALAPPRQLELLQTFWEHMKTPAMVRPLEALVEQPDRRDSGMLRALAIQRLYELDPRAGRPHILAEIRRPQAGGDATLAKALSLLPDESLPQFDETLAARLEATDSPTISMDARLIARYSTAAILARVKAVYEKRAGRWACDLEDGLGVYFLRVDQDYGLERVEANAGRCMTESVKAAVTAGRWQDIEPAIIARLSDTDVWAAHDAAETLARYGGPKAQKALWQRLRAFHRQWVDRDSELVISPGMARDANDAVSLQFGLVESLGHAQAWLLDNDQLAELESLALGGDRQNVQQWHWQSPVEIDLSALSDGQLLAMIGQFNAADIASLQAKLTQYPRGTVFHLSTFGAPERLAAAERAVRDTASQNGLLVADDR